MRVRFVIVSVLLILSLAACASDPAPSVAEPAGPHLTVIAHDIAFDTTELKLTTNQPTRIFFVNHDNGVPHNIAISVNLGGAPTMFEGALISQGAIVYDVPAFSAGSYHFYCTVHPNMNGTVQVTP